MKRIFSTRTSRIVSIAGALALVGTAYGVATASKAPKTVDFTKAGVPFVKGELLIRAKSKAALERFVANQAEALGTLAERVPLVELKEGGWFKVKMNEASSMALGILEASNIDGIELAEPNYIYYTTIGAPNPRPTPRPSPTAAPTPGNPSRGGPDFATIPGLPQPPQADPRVGDLYGLTKIKAPAVWNTQKGDKKIVVANIDTGADYNHEDLINNIWRNPSEVPGDGKDNDGNGFVDDVVGYDFRDKDARPFDDNNHGSHTTGTIAATGGNGKGVSGVAQNASVMVLRFLGGAQGSGTSEDAIKCIEYATKNGASIMSNSWGGGGYSQALFDAIKAANDKGILFVAAAGNETRDNDARQTYPANYKLPNILTVAATDKNDALASFSNYGAGTVHVAAPGVQTLSTIPNNQYKAFSGTSMATPHVAGAAYLLKSAYPNLKAAELKALLMDSVDRVPGLSSKVSTGGRINLESAFALARDRFGAPASN